MLWRTRFRWKTHLPSWYSPSSHNQNGWFSSSLPWLLSLDRPRTKDASAPSSSGTPHQVGQIWELFLAHIRVSPLQSNRLGLLNYLVLFIDNSSFFSKFIFRQHSSHFNISSILTNLWSCHSSSWSRWRQHLCSSSMSLFGFIHLFLNGISKVV